MLYQGLKKISGGFGTGDPSWSIWSLGFGNDVTTSASQGDVTSLAVNLTNPIPNISLANTPQMMLSIGYFLVNNLLTVMLVAKEWNKLGYTKVKLRTTTPQGQQRSKYFLQLPYKYSLPLIIIASTLHYLVSESFLAVKIIMYKFNENGELYDIINFWELKYSPLAIIIAISVGFIFIAIPIALAFRKLHPGIPIVGSNSALISAACHPALEGDASLLPVKWGVTATSIDPETGIGRCSISSGEVSEPIEGHLYL